MHKVKTQRSGELFAKNMLIFHFYSASALLAMQSAVLARGIPSVCLSVCLSVRPSCSGVSRRMKIRSCGFQQFSAASFWRGKVYPDIRRGSPPAGALKWGTLLSIGKIRPIIGHNLETAQDRRLVTINHYRKSHMGFRWVPKSVTLNDLERRNGRIVCVISPNSVAFRPYYVKVVEDTPIHSASEM